MKLTDILKEIRIIDNEPRNNEELLHFLRARKDELIDKILEIEGPKWEHGGWDLVEIREVMEKSDLKYEELDDDENWVTFNNELPADQINLGVKPEVGDGYNKPKPIEVNEFKFYYMIYML